MGAVLDIRTESSRRTDLCEITDIHESSATAAPRSTAPAVQRLLKGYLHKTSNSLCGIKGYASLIAGPEVPSGRHSAWAQKIIHEVEKMEEIFRSVGDMTSERGNPDLGVPLPGLLDDVFGVCEKRCPGLQVFCGRVPHGQILLPKADLCLVLTEILCNAWEGPRGRPAPVRVVVSVGAGPHGRLSLRVADDGPGIAADLLPQVRDPFLTTKDGHVGVGLTRVETLLDMYGLAWTLNSAPGAGVTVTFEAAESLD